jgi:hypothetical protein
MAHSSSDFDAASLPSSAPDPVGADESSSWFGEPQMASPSIRAGTLTAWQALFPGGSLLLIVLLIVFAPLGILTGESLLLPLFDEFQSLGQGLEPSLPVYYFVKVLLYGVLTWLALVQVIYRLEVLYVSAWSQATERPHPLHVDYQPHNRDSMMNLLGWTAYRTGRLVLPPVGLSLFSFAMTWGEFTLFNTVLASPAFSLPVPFIVGLFILLLVFMYTGVSILQSVWNAFKTVYGSCIAITEPNLPFPIAFSRSIRLSWVTKRVGLLLLGYAVGWLAFIGYVAMLLITYDIDDLIRFTAHWPAILGAGLLLVIWTIALTGYKFYAYHQALRAYYIGLPAAVQAQFTPPPSRYASDHPGERHFNSAGLASSANWE